MRETTYWPKLCLIQAAAPGGIEADDRSAGRGARPGAVPGGDARHPVLKVFHAARQDVEIFNNLGAIPQPLFDTQIAGMAAGFGEQIAYDALVRKILKVDLDKSHRFTDWSRRPLSEAQLDLRARRRHPPGRALSDPAARLEKAGRLSWVTEEMAAMTDPALYDVDPENAWRRLKPRKHQAKYLAVFRPWRPGASAPPSSATSRAAAS